MNGYTKFESEVNGARRYCIRNLITGQVANYKSPALREKGIRMREHSMNKKGHGRNMHIIIALAVLAGLYYLNMIYQWMEISMDTQSLVLLVITGVIYSMMPDIDQPASVINKYVTIGLVGIIIWAFYTNQMQYGIIAAVILGLLRLIEHRTLIHSVVGAIIISAPMLYFGIIYFIVAFIAFVSHIVSDGDFSLFAEKDWKLWKK